MKNYFFIRKNNSYVKVKLEDILYLEARKNFVSVVTTKKTYLLLISLTQMEKMLMAHDFCRVHRSFLVSLNQVDSFDFSSVYVKDKVIPIGNYYREKLKDAVTIIVNETRDNGALKVAKDYLIGKEYN